MAEKKSSSVVSPTATAAADDDNREDAVDINDNGDDDDDASEEWVHKEVERLVTRWKPEDVWHALFVLGNEHSITVDEHELPCKTLELYFDLCKWDIRFEYYLHKLVSYYRWGGIPGKQGLSGGDEKLRSEMTPTQVDCLELIRVCNRKRRGDYRGHMAYFTENKRFYEKRTENDIIAFLLLLHTEEGKKGCDVFQKIACLCLPEEKAEYMIRRLPPLPPHGGCCGSSAMGELHAAAKSKWRDLSVRVRTGCLSWSDTCTHISALNAET